MEIGKEYTYRDQPVKFIRAVADGLAEVESRFGDRWIVEAHELKER